MIPVHKTLNDATVLRTCKAFYDLGIAQLYRQRMNFGMLGGTRENAPFTMINGKTYCPQPHKPDPGDEHIRVAMDAILQGVELTKVLGFVYHDKFLRML